MNFFEMILHFCFETTAIIWWFKGRSTTFTKGNTVSPSSVNDIVTCKWEDYIDLYSDRASLY